MSMLVPDFWAESEVKTGLHARGPTVRRFGWSETNQADAQAMADQRVEDALAHLRAGEQVEWRDRKVPYNGAQGLPIREQVVSRHGDEVITRNSYGALCLNTPRVLIADVDCPAPVLRSWWFVWLALYALTAFGVVWWIKRVWSAPPFGSTGALVAIGIGTLLGALVTVVLLAIAVGRARERQQAQRTEPWAQALQRVSAFVAAHPDWGVRAYRTPAGWRLIVTHRTFEADEPVVAEFFESVQADTQYIAMCRNQKCFRARLTGKPWRMGKGGHAKPHTGVWPVPPDRLTERTAWLADYDGRAQAFAACRYEQSLGAPLMALDVAPVVQLHDELSRALRTDLPIA